VDSLKLYHELRLFTDNYGVTHWRYGMRGILLVCGMEQFYNGSFTPEPETFPSCVQCIAMVDRERHKGPV
jgi:hypothetical protein